MTLDEAIRAVLTAVQPHIDSDLPNPRNLEDAIREINKLFEEEPQSKAAFIAAVQAVATEARKGWRPA